MMILQLFIFAALFLITAGVFFFKRKKVLGILFTLIGVLLGILAFVVVHLYPHTLEF